MSVAPASGDTELGGWGKPEYKIFKDVSKLIGDDEDDEYPFDELKLEQGFFIPTQPNSTTDVLLAHMQERIERIKKRYGSIETDEHGDDVWESVLIRNKKRNDDGTVQLQHGKPITGANQTNRPKYIYTRNFVVKPVVKGQELGDKVKADADGVMVIRVA